MNTTILKSNNNDLCEIYKNNKQIELEKLEDRLIEGLYTSSNYLLRIKENNSSYEFLAINSSDSKIREYKWEIRIISGEIDQDFKIILINKDTNIIEESTLNPVIELEMSA
ncbi:MAG: hypothetical protein RRZ92_04460 [Bacilli bacterium]